MFSVRHGIGIKDGWGDTPAIGIMNDFQHDSRIIGRGTSGTIFKTIRSAENLPHFDKPFDLFRGHSMHRLAVPPSGIVESCIFNFEAPIFLLYRVYLSVRSGEFQSKSGSEANNY